MGSRNQRPAGSAQADLPPHGQRHPRAGEEPDAVAGVFPDHRRDHGGADMSDAQMPREFEKHVGSAVDPIPASPQRKHSMREELLAHLRGAYEQELAENKPPETAMAAAIDRFGNLDLIRNDLHQSVPVL